MKKRILYPLIIIVSMLCAPTAMFAAYDPACDCDPGDPDATVNAPIDDGLGILIAAGIAFGVKKAYNQKKKLVPAA